ncbi:MAG: hypothetical protein FJ224_06200 [Lentisphaerae bacterium]|nr:hypothetical protein [Lentisphaerota bacterium]
MPAFPLLRPRSFAAAGAFLLLGVTVCAAFEQMPEYHGLSMDEEREMDSALHADAEYTSDFTTYQFPFEWDYAWLTSTQAFNITVGSLAPRKFLIQGRLKIDQEVLPGFHLRYLHFAQKDIEEDQERGIVEAMYLPGRWGVAVYGEPSLYKKEDSAGAAVLWMPGPSHMIRFYATVMELDHARFDGDGSYTQSDKRQPASLGVVGRLTGPASGGSGDFLEYSLRVETPSDRLWPLERRRHRQKRGVAAVAFQKEVGEGRWLAGRFQVDNKYERDFAADPKADVEEQAIERNRVLCLLQHRFPAGGLEFAPAIAYCYRAWKPDGHDLIEFSDIQPQCWVRFPAEGTADFLRRWSCGYETTFRSGSDTEDLYGEDAPDRIRDEHRLNLRYDMTFGNRGTLSLLFTFDADQLGSGESWEGGNGQLCLYF